MYGVPFNYACFFCITCILLSLTELDTTRQGTRHKAHTLTHTHTPQTGHSTQGTHSHTLTHHTQDTRHKTHTLYTTDTCTHTHTPHAGHAQQGTHTVHISCLWHEEQRELPSSGGLAPC